MKKIAIAFTMIVMVMSFGLMACDDGEETVSSPTIETPFTPTHVATGTPTLTTDTILTLEPTESPTETEIPTPTSITDSGTCITHSSLPPPSGFEMTIRTPLGEAPAIVQFDTFESLGQTLSGLNEPISWEWDFGDGTSVNTENTKHQYSSVGTYYVNLTVADCSGRTSNTTGIVRLEVPYGEIVSFPDTELELEIREHIDWIGSWEYSMYYQGDIYESYLEEIAHIDGEWLCSDDIVCPRRIADLTGIEYCKNLQVLQLVRTGISDISPLSVLINLNTLDLNYNEISDLFPLVENTGLAEGDRVDVRYNPLNELSINEYIPQLEQRGVIVDY